MSEMTRSEKAMEYFINGYNCSQAVALAFKDLLPIGKKELVMMTSSFGGGVGHLREICGSLTGMATVMGLLYGFSDPTDQAAKEAQYERIQAIAEPFRERYGTLRCGELLGKIAENAGPKPEPRTEKYYKVRPCAAFIGMVAEELEEYIKTHEVPSQNS